MTSIPADTIEASLENQTFSISTTNNSANFNTISADEFPSVALVTDKKPLLKISKDDLVKAVNRVAFAAATDDRRRNPGCSVIRRYNIYPRCAELHL